MRSAPSPTKATLLVVLAAAVALSGCIASDEPSEPTTTPEEPEPQVNMTTAGEILEGRLVCGVGTPSQTVNACVVMEGSQNVFTTSVDHNLSTLLVGLSWDPTTPAGERLHRSVESNDYNGLTGEGYRYYATSGDPGFFVRIDNDDIENEERSWAALGAATLQLRVFPGAPASVVVDQPFEIHVMGYYNGVAPEGATPFAPMGNTTA